MLIKFNSARINAKGIVSAHGIFFNSCLNAESDLSGTLKELFTEWRNGHQHIFIYTLMIAQTVERFCDVKC